MLVEIEGRKKGEEEGEGIEVVIKRNTDIIKAEGRRKVSV